MCGICGFSGFEDNQCLHNMVKIQNHRGPDDNGTFIDENISLGHSRLSIIDLSSKGRQPLSNEDGNIWITFNGEIYNYRELKTILDKHKFSTQTDTEVIIHLYEEFDLAFIDKLIGMFSFCIYDKRKRIVILARDLLGKKPLYYYFNGQILIFASEIKAILEAFSTLSIEKEMDINGVYSFLQNSYVLGYGTTFSGIRKVLPGNILLFDLKSKEIRIQEYWNIQARYLETDENHITQMLRGYLEKAVRYRLVADVPIGSFLSGGLDSGAITALAVKDVDYDFHTFSIDFNTNRSELGFAHEVANHLGTIHHDLTIDSQDFLSVFDLLTWHNDEPIGDAALIANYFLSINAKKYVKVALAGEGGDELFGGYPQYRFAQHVDFYYKHQTKISHFLNFLIMKNPICGDPFHNKYCNYLSYFSKNNIKLAHNYTWSETTDLELKWLGFTPRENTQNNLIYPKDGFNSLDKLLAVDCKNHLPGLYLMKADKSTMAASIEQRLPLLDKNLVDFSFSIPSYLKMNQKGQKYILKMAVKDLLPKNVVERKKQGFDVPYIDWINENFKDLISQRICDGEIINKLFNKDKITKFISKFKNTNLQRPAMLAWSLFCLERWSEVYQIL